MKNSGKDCHRTVTIPCCDQSYLHRPTPQASSARWRRRAAAAQAQRPSHPDTEDQRGWAEGPDPSASHLCGGGGGPGSSEGGPSQTKRHHLAKAAAGGANKVIFHGYHLHLYFSSVSWKEVYALQGLTEIRPNLAKWMRGFFKSKKFSKSNVSTPRFHCTPQPNRSKVFGLNCGSNPHGDLL